MIEREFASRRQHEAGRKGAPRGTAVLAVAASALVGSLWTGLTDLDAGSVVPVSSGGSAPAVHVVRPGDTFWSIAEQLEPGRDPRPVVDALVRAHGGTVLRAGERITLPHALRP